MHAMPGSSGPIGGTWSGSARHEGGQRLRRHRKHDEARGQGRARPPPSAPVRTVALACRPRQSPPHAFQAAVIRSGGGGRLPGSGPSWGPEVLGRGLWITRCVLSTPKNGACSHVAQGVGFEPAVRLAPTSVSRPPQNGVRKRTRTSAACSLHSQRTPAYISGRTQDGRSRRLFLAWWFYSGRSAGGVQKPFGLLDNFIVEPSGSMSPMAASQRCNRSRSANATRARRVACSILHEEHGRGTALSSSQTHAE